MWGRGCWRMGPAAGRIPIRTGKDDQNMKDRIFTAAAASVAAGFALLFSPAVPAAEYEGTSTIPVNSVPTWFPQQ